MEETLDTVEETVETELTGGETTVQEEVTEE